MPRGIPLFLSKVSVFDENNTLIGGFKQKLFSIRGSFRVLDTADEAPCTLQGKWTSWNFKFLTPGDVEPAQIRKGGRDWERNCSPVLIIMC